MLGIIQVYGSTRVFMEAHSHHFIGQYPPATVQVDLSYLPTITLHQLHRVRDLAILTQILK